MKILCLIPARSGSKGLPDKNIKMMVNKPLMVWSIEQAKETEYYKRGDMRIVVSTDSEKYKDIGLKWGAEVPFLRPKELSKDNSTDLMFLKHALYWLNENEKYKPEYILHLRPTQPCREKGLIDDCLNKFIGSEFDSLRTVIPTKKTPYKMYIKKDDELLPLFDNVNGIYEPYNIGRQYLPKTYLHNGYVDIIKSDLLRTDRLSGKILAYEMGESDNIDIDTEEDWDKARNKLL
jgi:CMP-N,N'-diacetyllegionaminic acid synthase